MRSTNPYIKNGTFQQRHEHTAYPNMPRSIGWVFHRIWFIDSEERVTEDLYIDLDLIDKCIDQENMDASTEVADEVDVAILNAFAAHIVSNAEEFMSPHQVACLTALLLASCQDGSTRVSTLETARNELLLWQQEYEPATKIMGIFKADFHADTASEIARKAADENIKQEYVAVINRVAAVARKAADSTEKFRRFLKEDSSDTEGLREAAQEVTKAVKISEEAVKTANELLEIVIAAKWKNYAAKRRFIKAEQDFLRIHEA